jgi:type IV pilus assembly protein PilQ
MRKQLFKNPYCLKITFFLLFFTCWPVVSVYSSVFPDNHQFNSSSPKVIDHKGEYIVPSIVLAQNQSSGLSNESFGEIIVLNTSVNGSSSVVSIESDQSVQYTAFKLLDPLRLILDFQKMNQGNLTRLIQVDKEIVNSIHPIYFKEVGVLRLEINLNQMVDYQIQKPENNKLIVHLQPSELIPREKKAKSEKETALVIESTIMENHRRYVVSKNNSDPRDTCFPMLYGEKEVISLDFQNAEVRSLFRIFAEVSGFNVILSPEVKGFVSTRMMDVAWNEAMEIILTNNGLGRECFGNNVVRIVTKRVLEAEEIARAAKNSRALAEKANKINAQELVTKVVRIDHANIIKLAKSLATFKSARIDSQITVDTRTNTLILNDLRRNVDGMLETIKVLDIPTAQVLIEAKVVEVNKSFARELGIQWGLTGELDSQNVNKAALSASLNSNHKGNFLVDLAQTSNQGADSLPGFGIAMGGLLPGLGLNMRLQALEKQGKGRILSSPKVTTADNKEARISSGRQIPYQVTSAAGNSTEFVDAELRLEVVPHITSDNKVYMIIDTTINAADFNQLVERAPTITTHGTHTEVLVGNGDTTVLGGFYESISTDNKDEAPFFSKIPLLGLLFGNSADSDTIAELLVFITPTIIETN